ncbi:hypothetical protein CEXT_789701 [Caerostris extrusa]|uniref:Uncharacterized protein n=1 Tax=Caerostris extrusa TaxID=172846 RepID=A0AAV4YC19_CAEEX|nr:hypothetical protein CEXT_789701 [Caerostris extrusa]
MEQNTKEFSLALKIKYFLKLQRVEPQLEKQHHEVAKSESDVVAEEDAIKAIPEEFLSLKLYTNSEKESGTQWGKKS